MKERQHPNPLESLIDTAASDGPPEANKLAAVRDMSNELSATAERILNRLDANDSQAFLEQVRQSGGQ